MGVAMETSCRNGPDTKLLPQTVSPSSQMLCGVVAGIIHVKNIKLLEAEKLAEVGVTNRAACCGPFWDRFPEGKLGKNGKKGCKNTKTQSTK